MGLWVLADDYSALVLLILDIIIFFTMFADHTLVAPSTLSALISRIAFSHILVNFGVTDIIRVANVVRVSDIIWLSDVNCFFPTLDLFYFAFLRCSHIEMYFLFWLLHLFDWTRYIFLHHKLFLFVWYFLTQPIFILNIVLLLLLLMKIWRLVRNLFDLLIWLYLKFLCFCYDIISLFILFNQFIFFFNILVYFWNCLVFGIEHVNWRVLELTWLYT